MKIKEREKIVVLKQELELTIICIQITFQDSVKKVWRENKFTYKIPCPKGIVSTTIKCPICDHEVCVNYTKPHVWNKKRRILVAIGFILYFPMPLMLFLRKLGIIVINSSSRHIETIFGISAFAVIASMGFLLAIFVPDGAIHDKKEHKNRGHRLDKWRLLKSKFKCPTHRAPSKTQRLLQGGSPC